MNENSDTFWRIFRASLRMLQPSKLRKQFKTEVLLSKHQAAALREIDFSG